MENNSKDIINNDSNDGVTVIKTDIGSQSGQNKCPKCGATDISPVYRNTSARHTYEKETKHDMKNLKKIDNFLRSKNGQSNRMMQGANNNYIGGKFH